MIMDSSNINPLHKKVEKILYSEIDLDTLNALKNVSELIEDNTLTTRRNLRAKIETQSLSINEHFATSFNEVYQKFQKLSDYVSFIDSACENMMTKIEELKFQTSDFCKSVNQLSSDLQELNDNEKTLNKFLDEFTLSPNELAIINSDSKVDENFFEVLNKIRQIYEKAKTMLASSQSITGIEIMDMMSKYEEMANEKLYRWTVKILRSINIDFIELHSYLFDALAHLQHKDVLFKHCMSEYTIVRRSAVTHAFIEVLTRGRNSNNTQYPAMELYSNDIVRYIRDMLSFLHQTFVFERDMLKTLLKSCNQDELIKKNVLKNVISSITEGVIRILKIRVDNCLITNDSNIDSQVIHIKRTKNFFLVKNIINFYLQTFNQMLNEDCQFIYFIKELLVSSDRVCYNSLKFNCSLLGQKIDCYTVSSKSKPNVKELMQYYIHLIDELLDCIRSSMSFSVQEQQLETQRILSCILEPCIQCVIISSSKFSPIEMTVFNLNCFNALKMTIEKHKFTESFIENLQNRIEESSEILANEQFQFIINSLSMNSLYNSINQNALIKNNVPLSTLSGCDPIAVSSFLNSFDKFINNPNKFAMKRLDEINDQTIRNKIWKNSLKMVLETYVAIYNLLIDPENKYTEIIDSIKHKPDDVSKILLQ